MAFNRIPLKDRQLWGDRRSIVLVGDSDPEIQCMATQLTPPDLYRIEETLNPVDLADHLRWSETAVLIVDVDIIKQSNELRNAIESRSRLGVPVIVTAQGDSEADEILARSLGCVLYAPKPCGYWQMHQAVTELLCNRAARGVAL